MAVLLWPLVSHAQSPSPPAQRIELSFQIGVSRPSIVVEESGGLRTPPTIRDTGESYRTFTQDVSARIWWTRRMSTIVGGGWSTDESAAYTFPKPTSPPSFPFTGYESQRTVSYHNRLFWVSQAWDLTTSGPIVPFVGGGAEFRSVVRRQDSTFVDDTDPSSISSSTTERSGLQIAALGTVGARILAGQHLSIVVDGSLFAPEWESSVATAGGVFLGSNPDTTLGRINGRWRAGVGVGF